MSKLEANHGFIYQKQDCPFKPYSQAIAFQMKQIISKRSQLGN